MENNMSEYVIVKKPKKRRFSREESIEEFTLVDLLRKKKEETKALEDFLKEQQKIEKKDEKKPQGRTFTFTEGLLLAFILQYTLGPAISAMLKAQGLQ
jgi:hypothetical protein